MFSMLNLAIFDSIVAFFESIASTLQYEYLLYVLVGAFVLYAIMTFIKTRFSYEVRAIRSFKKINKYFLKKPYINETNLVEFNKKMKKLPYQLRDRWQYFMLNREGLPSDYMTLYHCVEQPIKTSSYNSTVTLARSLSTIVIVIGFILGLLVSAQEALSVYNLARAIACPLIFFLLSEVYIIFLRSRFNALSIDLYEYFIVFTRNLDKASVSIPDYIDYELLFTNKEIREGIPVLREYLEKKALMEQVALEKAKSNLEEREKFDFEKYGIDGSLVLERAMETTQDYLNNRRRLLEEIAKLEHEKEKNNESYVDAEKDAQKKLQAIKENLERMQMLMEESASRIEQNYIKKQQADEIKKRDQINKDLDDMRLKFGQEMQFLEKEIKKREDEINDGKNTVQEAMNSEFETYSQKVYTSIKNQLDEDNADELSLTKQELIRTKEIVEKDEQQLENKNVELELKQQQIDTLRSEYEKVSGDLEKFVSTDRRGVKELYRQNSEMQGKVQSLRDLVIAYKKNNNETIYFDENGNFVDIDSYKDDKGKFKELPKVYDENGNFIDFSQFYNKRGQLLNNVEEAPVLSNFLPSEEVEKAEEVVEENEIPGEVDESAEFVEEPEIVEEPETAVEEIAETEEEIAEEPEEESEGELEEEAQESDEPVYYDENGNVVDFAQYYNEDGSFKEFPKVYDADGNYYDFADYYDKYGNPLPQEGEDDGEEIPGEIEEFEETEKNEAEEEIEEPVETVEEIQNEEKLDEFAITDEDIAQAEAEYEQELLNQEQLQEVAEEQEEIQEEQPQEENIILDEEQSGDTDSQEEIVYYDAEGNPVDFEQYYNEDGTLKEFPKVYDAEGNYYDFADYYDVYGNPLPQNQSKAESIGIVAVEEQPKRKRGRPPKNKTVEEQPKRKITRLGEEESAPRKRGRPAKVKEETVVETPKKRGRPAKTKEVENVVETTPKKRGRPSKKSQEEVKPAKKSMAKKEDETPKRRGRPAKENEETVIETPRKRGRPAKAKDNANKADVAPKKRGRPAKTSQEEAKPAKKSMAKKEDETPKRRGRPKGSTKNSDDKQSPKKRATRIKKDALAELDSKINEESEKLKKQQSELKSQISQTLSELQATNANDSNLAELKEIVARLKAQASEAKKNGLSKEEQQQINKSLAELLRAMAQKK